MAFSLRPLLGSVLVFAASCFPVQGQATEDEIKARLATRPLYLRGFWRDANLTFDAQGKLIGQSLPTSFTLSGFDFHSAHIKKDKLVLEGKRVGVEFIKDRPKRVRLDQAVRINILLPDTGDFTRPLDTIFADDLTDLAPTLPSYWQRWAKSKLLAQQTAKPATTAGSASDSREQDSAGQGPPKKVGGTVQAPRLKAHREAEFDETARQLKYSGKTQIGFIVNTEGVPDHLIVVRPTGLGLDEQALSAVQSYRFTPATQDGKPVRVEVDVEVAFDIY